MNTIRIGRLLAVAALAAGGSALVTAAPAGAATPSQTGCPAAYQLLSVADLEAQSSNYKLPRKLDESGNHDGYVCGRRSNDQAAQNFCDGPCPVPVLYDFQENDRTPAHKS